MTNKGSCQNPRDLARSEAHQLMTRMDPEPQHALQVCRLALSIFDQLLPLHGLGAEERSLLECAALLHDIGWNVQPTAHHKGSQEAILAASLAGLDEEQRLLVALVARYHRKSPPRIKHSRYRSLSQEERRLVRVLAGILRIADGLDRSHSENVREIACDLYEDQLRLRIVTRTRPDVELYGLQKKAGLLEETFGLTVWAEPVQDLKDS